MNNYNFDNFALYSVFFVIFLLGCLIIYSSIYSISEKDLCEEQYTGCQVYKCKADVENWINKINLELQRYEVCLLEQSLKED